MTWRLVIHEAWRALCAHRLRATLSGAGLVFGVATVVAALAIAEGARRRAYEDAAALGVENAFLRARPPGAGHPPMPRFAPSDVDALARDLRGAIVAASRHLSGALDTPSGLLPVSIAGATPRWHLIAGLEIAEGRWLSAGDLEEHRRVMVLTPALAARIRRDGGGVGSRLRWQGQWFTIIGVLAPTRRAADQPDAFIPLTTADARLAANDDGRGAQEIGIRIGGDGIEAAAQRAERLLARRGHPRESYETIVPLALLRAKLQAQRMFDWVLFGVGALALMISGIGIMNIMLASVAERTGEIGVRRAAGARRRDVLAQFAAEAALLCVAGGAAGVPLGAVFAALIAAGAGWPVAIAPSSVALALLLAASVGMIFGTYPAQRAARLDPVDALRA